MDDEEGLVNWPIMIPGPGMPWTLGWGDGWLIRLSGLGLWL